jgi:hypothetical protein
MSKKNKICPDCVISASILLGMIVMAFKKPKDSMVGARNNKYHYERVLQSNHGYGWDDEMSVDTDSTGWIKDKAERDLWKENKKLYRENVSAPLRTISRKTLKK